MTDDCLSEVVTKDGTDYFIQEMYHGPKAYFAMTRKARYVLDCEKEAVESLPREEI